MKLLSLHVGMGRVAVATTLLAGCAGIRMPDLYHPGPAGYQRANALQWDPYPLPDVGPSVDGGRPREFSRPIPEPTHIQRYTPKRPQLQPIPWPTLSLPSLPATPAQPVYPYAPPVTPVPPPSIVRPPY